LTAAAAAPRPAIASDRPRPRILSPRRLAEKSSAALQFGRSLRKGLIVPKIAKVGVLGASGYTGSESVRLLLRHPQAEIALLTADRRAGHELRDVFPQFSPFALPKLVAIDGLDWAALRLDLVLCALPHATTQKVVKDLIAKAPRTKVVDLSADFRLADPDLYARWYGHEHHAPELQKEAVYGLVEVHRERIRTSRLIANPGCYTTCAQLPLVPLIKERVINVDEIVIDAKSGTTGAGRAAKENMLFSEVSEGFHAYGVAHHRHMAELDQEFSLAAGRAVTVTFTPHLVPMNRGILSTIYVRGVGDKSPPDLHEILLRSYRDEPFVHVLPFGEMPQTRHVRGSNMTFIGVAADRIEGRAIIGSALDNLVKGASGQAVQNMNLVLGFPEIMGLEQVALFP
jgi:N-acetyl-gamma-glutamyl-phosphate reductase